jgi:hypothetical protein
MHRSKYASSFDHLVGAGEQRGRDRQAESFGGLKIDNEFKSRRLFDGDVARPLLRARSCQWRRKLTIDAQFRASAILYFLTSNVRSRCYVFGFGRGGGAGGGEN